MNNNQKLGVALPPPPLKNSNKTIKIIDRAIIALKSFGYQKVFQDKNHSSSPLNPWAYIRVKNEIDTLQASLDSIVGGIKRGVIVYNECNDGSEEVIKNFCKKHQGFICVEYPYEVLGVEHLKQEREYKKTLPEFYNFALSFIPKNEWFIKIDCDQIYDSEKLQKSFSLAKSFNDVVVYMQLNLHIFDNRVFIRIKDPVVEHGDHFLMCNRDVYFVESFVASSEMECKSYEMLKRTFSSKIKKTQCVLWHFPYIKASRQDLAKIEDYVPLSEYKKVIPEKYLLRISLDMLDEERILSFLRGKNETEYSGGRK